MTVREAASILDVHENTIRNWIGSGRLRARSLPGGVRRPYAAEVVRLVEDDLPVALADDLDEVALRLERRAAALRAAAEAMRR